MKVDDLEGQDEGILPTMDQSDLQKALQVQQNFKRQRELLLRELSPRSNRPLRPDHNNTLRSNSQATSR